VFVAIEPESALADQLGDLPEVMSQTGYDFPFETVTGMSYLGSYELHDQRQLEGLPREQQ
jgi:hypothetical protein